MLERILDIENGKVSARELYKWLESKQDYTTWIKNRIEKYGFIENEDFTFHKFMERKTWKHDYIISLDMAKELSMIENNDKGKEARKYFIQCEKELQEIKLNNIKSITMIFTHRDKLKLTKQVLYPILDGMGVLKNKRAKVHDMLKREILGKYEDVKMVDKFDIEIFVEEYTRLAEIYKKNYPILFRNENQISFWMVIE